MSDRVLGRGDESDAYEKEAFSLAEGRSQPGDPCGRRVLCAQMYGRLRRGRDGGAQGAHLRGAEKRAFQEIYDRFSNTISVSYSSGLWDSLDLTSEFEKNDADFF